LCITHLLYCIQLALLKINLQTASLNLVEIFREKARWKITKWLANSKETLARLLTNKSLANKKADASGGDDEQRLVLYSTYVYTVLCIGTGTL